MSDITRSFFATPRSDEGLPVLLDRYRVLGVLGEGGMGTVFKAFHLQLKRYVAIKTVRVDGSERPHLVTRFVREMEAVGQMDHPHVVRAFDAGEKNGVFYLVMEFLDGADLDRVVARRGALDTADACELARQAALGLAYAHEKLVHRDVKPSNLMLTAAGQVKVLDLGLARFADVQGNEGTPEGCAVGTHDYVAPEQVAGATLDGRADVYSLGCAMFKLLAGRPPYSGPSYDTVAKKLFAHCHIPLSEAPGFRALPPDVGAVLVRMTAKDPADRYSAPAAAQALAPLAAGSRLPNLLGENTPADRSALHALPPRLPESLSRLTVFPHDTPMHTPAVERPPGPAAPRRRLRALLGAGLAVIVLSGVAWFVAPTVRSWLAAGLVEDAVAARRIDKEAPRVPPDGPRPLDQLAVRSHHLLLDQPPLPLGGADDDDRNWRWDAKEQQLDVKGHDDMLFMLGTTTRGRFELEVGIAQAPWAGRVGIFWGYQEDAAARKARRPGTDFGRFQMLVSWQRPGDQGEPVYSVHRGHGVLTYDPRGRPRVRPSYSHRHDLPAGDLAGGEKILRVAFHQNWLRGAWLGAVKLADLTNDAANQSFQGQPYDGGLGLISLSYSATFDKARFFPR